MLQCGVAASCVLPFNWCKVCLVGIVCITALGVITIFSDGCLGSGNDEGHSEV